MQKKSEKIKSLVLDILLILNIMFIIIISGKYIYDRVEFEKMVKELDSGNLWSSTYTPLDDFEYYIEGNQIYIREYIGDDYKIKLSDNYRIEGKTCHIVSIDKPYTMLKNARSVLIPDGVVTLGNSHYEPYEGAETMFIYLPGTLEQIRGNFWNCFVNLKKVYYGGSKEKWNELTSDMALPENVLIEFNVSEAGRST